MQINQSALIPLPNNADDGLPLGASVSTLSMRVLVSDPPQKRKRSDTNNINNNADDSQPAKKGKPNLPPGAEPLYRAARNALAKSAKHSANATMLLKYDTHTEHLVPASMRLRATPPFGADDTGSKSGMEGHHLRSRKGPS